MGIKVNSKDGQVEMEWKYNEAFFISENRKNVCACGKKAQTLSIDLDRPGELDEYPEYREVIFQAEDDLEGQATLTGVAICDACHIYGSNSYS